MWIEREGYILPITKRSSTVSTTSTSLKFPHMPFVRLLINFFVKMSESFERILSELRDTGEICCLD